MVEEIRVVTEVERIVVENGRIKTVLRVETQTAIPEQNEHLPYRVEMTTEVVGHQFMRDYYRVMMERADLELCLKMRAGKEGLGIQRMGRRAYTFKTIFGTVVVPRIRIKYKGSGKSETPSSRMWKLPRQVCLSRGLKNAVCNLAMKESYGSALKQIERETGEAGIISKSSLLNIVHAEGAKISAAEIERADKVFGSDERGKILLGRAASHLAEDYFERTWLPGEDLETMDVQQAFNHIEWEPTIKLEQISGPAQSAVEPSEPAIEQSLTASDAITTVKLLPSIAANETIETISLNRDENQDQRGHVASASASEPQAEQIIAQIDEVVVRKQPGGKREKIVHYNGTIKTAERTYYCQGSTSAQLIYQAASIMAQLGMQTGDKKLLVLSDCAGWINNWVSGIGIDDKEAIFCWWHLRTRCRELVGEAFNKDSRDEVRKVLLKYLWRGRVNKALSYVKKLIEDVEDGISKLSVKSIGEIEAIKNYLIKRKPYIPDYQARQKNKQWIASTQIEKFNAHAISARCKGNGQRWTSKGVLAMAALETASRNSELGEWQSNNKLPTRAVAA